MRPPEPFVKQFANSKWWKNYRLNTTNLTDKKARFGNYLPGECRLTSTDSSRGIYLVLVDQLPIPARSKAAEPDRLSARVPERAPVRQRPAAGAGRRPAEAAPTITSSNNDS